MGSVCLSLLFTQDDDIDDEHIVAFAEESDPGREKRELLNMWGTRMQIFVNFIYCVYIYTVYLVLLLVSEAHSNYSLGDSFMQITSV